MTKKSTIPDSIKRRRLLQGLGATGIAALAGCSGNQDNSGGGGNNSGGGANTSGTLKLAQVKSPLEFDPIVLNDVPSAQVSDRVFEGLYTYDSGINVVPKMATGKPEVKNGGKTYIVEYQKGIKFQNGDSLTAEDIAYSFTAPVKEETENASTFTMIDSVSKAGKRKVKFDLKYPYGPFMNVLTSSVVPKSVREKDKKKFNKKNPIGTGPFKFDDWQEGNYVKISRWDDYWGKPKPNLANVKMVPVEEPTTRLTSLQTGENDIIEEIPPKLWKQVQNMSDTSIESKIGMGYFYLAFNCKNGPTTDPKVREAIDYCFDMDQAVSNFVEPSGVRQYSPLPEQISKKWGFPLDKWKKIPHDKNIDKAKELLKNSDNVPDNWNAKIIVPPDDKRQQLGVTVANGLKEAGYNANVQRLDWGAFLNKFVTGKTSDYNMYTLGWSGGPDPDDFLYYFFTKSAHGTNDGTYYNKVNKQIVEARKSSDHAKRKKLYTEAINKVLHDRAHLPAYNLKNSFGVKNKVNGFEPHPVLSFVLATQYTNASIGKQ
ncbi:MULTISPECIES: ABC transporter substrate-binding protein [unclassified Haladaptatus]|uniref:ABC transporter substrate-binding protein n=1 Tax=unclassified Haladaptatus TaxID=2622732 RepID=UPI00209C5440|nr:MULTISPECIES: ABC transporter substrate-binding protein [unclassified Haladaptatus]MCO8246561.1 ABC transporter substrate-binding protein [Haladaptatus sp. AB643]MCO8256316.1 ABC transporter substrate-binding protein [Haladaptatus sp. AB618]